MTDKVSPYRWSHLEHIYGAALRKVGRHIRPAPPMTYMPLIYDKLSHRTLLDAQIALAST